MRVRVAGILVEDDSILLLEQHHDDIDRPWVLPGGTVEEHETLEQAMIREMKEETGLDIVVEHLLYVSDHFSKNDHVVHISLRLRRVGGSFSERDKTIDTEEITKLEFVPINSITEKGFSEKFQELVQNNFPNSGTYVGLKSNIGL